VQAQISRCVNSQYTETLSNIKEVIIKGRAPNCRWLEKDEEEEIKKKKP
jgi:hypothetical protein